MSIRQPNTDLRKNKKMHKNRLIKQKTSKLDPRCQEATSEILRIEIDQIFKDFLDNPDQTEYIFPPDLNNLQRKYIHSKAQAMNIISKSYGKEPNRRLHIRKKSRQLENQCFVIKPCQATENYMQEFVTFMNSCPSYRPPYRRMHRREKVIGKLVNGVPTIPGETYLTREIESLRKSLPIHEERDLIIDAIRQNQVIIISSETGSGKTTQVSQFIMDDMRLLKRPCKIVCTQPRRISTVSAAERVAFERGDNLGASVGYHIKLEQKYGLSTNLIYCTTGVFLRNLMMGKEALTNITHIIIDEVHERDKLSDFLLICLKQTLPYFPELKIILMSATMNTTKFLDYFGQGKVLSIPGRLYNIDLYFLEDILGLVRYISPKMRDVMQKEEKKCNVSEHVAEDVAFSVLQDENIELDEALDDYLNFCDNYDYRVHYEEATVQLGMYFLSEGLSVDYQHSKTGRTALMIAAYLGDKEFISRLCNMGANLDLHCHAGKTAFDYAYDKPDTLRLLQFIANRRLDGTQNKNLKQSEGEYLLGLYDKTTSDEYIDFDLIVKVVSFIHNCGNDGSILIFLPGYDDIMLCNDRLINSQLVPGTYKIFFLHSSMNIRDQHEVFRHLSGKRKIILSTNIAETSITIDDVVFVIDTGKAKEKCYDSYNKVSSLQTRWISQACAKQRMGRAGRTRPGVCFRLFSKQRYQNMDEERVPEILRVSLEELCLHTKVIAPDGVNIHDFLTMAPDAPSANSIRVAIENLYFLGALDREEQLTPLGEYLAQLAIEPQLGKMLIYAVIFRCLEPILTLAAAMSHKDPFQLPPQANMKNKAAEKRRELLNDVMSDHLLYLAVFKRWQEETYCGNVNNFCHNYFISNPTMNSILETRSQLLGQLRAAGFVHQANSLDDYNQNANSWPLVKAIITTGVYPNLAYPSNQYLATRTEKKVNIHNSSSCFNKYLSTWLIFDEKIKHRNCLLLRGVTAVTTITASLLCGIDCFQPSPNSIAIDDWIEFEFPNNNPLIIRSSIDTLIKKVIAYPSYNYNNLDHKLVHTICSILDVEENVAGLKVPLNIGDKPRFFFPLMQGTTRRTRTRANPLRGSFLQSVNIVRRNKHILETISNCLNAKNSGADDTTQDDKQSDSNRLLNGLTNGQETTEEGNKGVEQLLNAISLENKFGDYSDEKIFILIRPQQKKSVEIAQQTNKWVFAPQTEKKILHFNGKGKSVFLLFTVKHSRAFQGMAEFLSFFYETSGKPTSRLNWIFKIELEFFRVRQLRNPYNENRSIYEGLDGQVIQETVAEELVRIYGEVKQHADSASTGRLSSQGCSSGTNS